MRRRPAPIPYAPRHHRDWRRLWRYCHCGLRWRCPDSLPNTPKPYPPLPRPLNRGPLYPEQIGTVTPIVRATPPRNRR